MELKELKKEVLDALKDAVIESIANDEKNACVTIDTNDGYIDVWFDCDNNAQVGVFHDVETNRTDNNEFYMCPNLYRMLEEYIESKIDWRVLEEEFEKECAEEKENLRHYEHLIY